MWKKWLPFLIAVAIISNPGTSHSAVRVTLPAYDPQILFPFLLKNLEPIYELCIYESDCGLNDREKKILIRIQNSLAEEARPSANLIRFDSSSKNPNLFLLDGNIRIAVTGDDVGDPIFVNLDLAFQKDRKGNVHPLRIEQVLAVLTHELGHHQGIKNHNELDILGLKVGAHLIKKIQWTAINGDNKHLQDPDTRELNIFVGSIQLPFSLEASKKYQSLIWIFDEYAIHDVTSTLGALLICTAGSVGGVRFFNWEADTWFPGSKKNIHTCDDGAYLNSQFYRLFVESQMTCNGQFKQFSSKVTFQFRWNCQNELSFDKQRLKYYLYNGIDEVTESYPAFPLF